MKLSLFCVPSIGKTEITVTVAGTATAVVVTFAQIRKGRLNLMMIVLRNEEVSDVEPLWFRMLENRVIRKGESLLYQVYGVGGGRVVQVHPGKVSPALVDAFNEDDDVLSWFYVSDDDGMSMEETFEEWADMPNEEGD